MLHPKADDGMDALASRPVIWTLDDAATIFRASRVLEIIIIQVTVFLSPHINERSTIRYCIPDAWPQRALKRREGGSELEISSTAFGKYAI